VSNAVGVGVMRGRAGLPLVSAEGDILNVGATHVAGDLRA
jgi:hypothetical protein